MKITESAYRSSDHTKHSRRTLSSISTIDDLVFINNSRMNNLTQDQKRNLHVLIIACVLNFSFAAVHDYIHDIKEGSTQNNNVLI